MASIIGQMVIDLLLAQAVLERMAVTTAYAETIQAPQSVIDMIDFAASNAGVSTTTAQAISWCESHYRQFNKDGTPLRSSTDDVGLFQINQIHNPEVGDLNVATSAADNIAFAMTLFKRNGTRDWYPSKHCWQPLIAKPWLIPTSTPA